MQVFHFHYSLARVLAAATKLLLVSLLVSTADESQIPVGFHWVDFKSEGSTVSKIEQALKAENYTAIREIGLADGSALVLAVWREPGQATPEGDQWLVYSVSTKDWGARTLLTGYNLQIKDWISLQSNLKRDIGVVYMDCWECEPASLFTALHYDPQEGWRARWVNDKDPYHPGIPFLFTDVGDPYTNEEVDQVFAVLAPRDGIARVGTWFHSRDLSSGKISESASRFSVDASTGKDKSVVLAGSEASRWKLQLCEAADSRSDLSVGQSSRACKAEISAEHKR